MTDEETCAAWERFQLIEELKRRNPDADWRTDPPCPDCGSLNHFECNGSVLGKDGE